MRLVAADMMAMYFPSPLYAGLNEFALPGWPSTLCVTRTSAAPAGAAKANITPATTAAAGCRSRVNRIPNCTSRIHLP
jgi:hypothetical protein